MTAVFSLQLNSHHHVQPYSSRQGGVIKWARIEMWPMPVSKTLSFSSCCFSASPTSNHDVSTALFVIFLAGRSMVLSAPLCNRLSVQHLSHRTKLAVTHAVPSRALHFDHIPFARLTSEYNCSGVLSATACTDDASCPH